MHCDYTHVLISLKSEACTTEGVVCVVVQCDRRTQVAVTAWGLYAFLLASCQDLLVHF